MTTEVTIGFRVDVYRNNVFFRSLNIKNPGSAQVNVNNTQTIKREMQCEFEDDPEINLLTDRFAPVQVLNGIEYPLGRYIAAEAPLNTKERNVTRSLRAYGLIYLADELSILEDRLTIPAGTKYTDAIQQQLILAGIDRFVIEPNSAVIVEDREDWEPGEKRIAVINQLCSEINYNQAYDDNNGVVQVNSYRRPHISNVDFTYKTDKKSDLIPSHSQLFDMFARYNVFVLVCENPEKDGTMVAKSTNNDPSSPVSTINVGRQILYREKLSNIATLAELQTKADNLKFENLMVPETVTLATGPRPQHDCFNILAVDKDGVQGIYQEQSWTLKLGSPGEMSHKLRRVALT